MNYSGFKLLNDTYYVHLKEARPAWINFTEMIMNISQTISEVLHHKTLLVKNLTDLVEKAFDEYRNDPERILESTKTVYFDAKSPKTFCDVQEASNARAAAAKQNLTHTGAATAAASVNATSTTNGLNSTAGNTSGGTGGVSTKVPVISTSTIGQKVKIFQIFVLNLK